METKRSRRANRGDHVTGNRPAERIPVSGDRDVLTVQGRDENYVYRWVNDVDNRIERFKAGGYEVVDHETTVGSRTADSSRGTASITEKHVGKGVHAYLMRIKKEWYEEDQQAKSGKIDESEKEMKRTLNSGQDGTYGKMEIE